MNDDSIRIVTGKTLTDEEKKLLDGAPVFDPEDLDAAIVGVLETPKGHVALYDYYKLCDIFYDIDDPSSTQEYAQEYVDYNLVRGLPYMGDRAPRIGLWVNVEDDEEYGSDVEYIRHRGKIYVRL